MLGIGRVGEVIGAVGRKVEGDLGDRCTGLLDELLRTAPCKLVVWVFRVFHHIVGAMDRLIGQGDGAGIEDDGEPRELVSDALVVQVDVDVGGVLWSGGPCPHLPVGVRAWVAEAHEAAVAVLRLVLVRHLVVEIEAAEVGLDAGIVGVYIIHELQVAAMQRCQRGVPSAQADACAVGVVDDHLDLAALVVVDGRHQILVER